MPALLLLLRLMTLYHLPCLRKCHNQNLSRFKTKSHHHLCFRLMPALLLLLLLRSHHQNLLRPKTKSHHLLSWSK